MKRTLTSIMLLLSTSFALSAEYDTSLPYETGEFEPNWNSLGEHYKAPDWFKDAKFGIWTVWGPQSAPEFGDWCGLFLYNPQRSKMNIWYSGQGEKISKLHREKYGHPSVFGMKDYIPMFTASKWNPDYLIDLFTKAGAKYFVTMANHHDNFDNWNSKFQKWNSVNLGPQKDIVGIWEKSARKKGLKFGVSVHAARTWDWFAPIFSSDKDGKYKGVKYDSFLTKEDGKGKWWEGYDPAELYTTPHKEGDPCSQKYLDNFYLRTVDLIDSYKPDLLYFDDVRSPLGKVGLKIYAHYYNSAEKWHNGKADVVINSKSNDKFTSKAVIEDVERGGKKDIYPTSWQTDTCIGGWHYNSEWAKYGYKSPALVTRMLVDIVSKNGNLLLNIPIKADGSIDDKEIAFLEGMAKWIAVNGEGIYGTRPWKKFGEGSANTKGEHFSDSADAKLKYTQEDFRFTKKGDSLYVFIMAIPTHNIIVKSVTPSEIEVKSVKLLGSDENIKWKQTERGLEINNSNNYPSETVACYKIN